jgi:hypothetical protein
MVRNDAQNIAFNLVSHRHLTKSLAVQQGFFFEPVLSQDMTTANLVRH